MLVLGRRQGERIRIGDTVCLTVLEVRGKTVRLGFSGSASVPIHREEVYQRIEQEVSESQELSVADLEARCSA